MWTGMTFSELAQAGTPKVAPRINQLQAATDTIDPTLGPCFFPTVVTVLVSQADGDRVGIFAGRNGRLT